MAEPFEAIGFRINDEASYQALAMEAHDRGTITRLFRPKGILHGSCWSLGAGLEVWTMVYESPNGTYFADCRPAFRNQQVYQFYPWEILEFEQEGEALLTGSLRHAGGPELVFALQNLTELNLRQLPWREVTAAVSGLAYRAKVLRPSRQRREPLIRPGLAGRECAENDYELRGSILAWRELRNQHTTSNLIWIRLDLGLLNLEILVNRADLQGLPKVGEWLTAEIWLQGYMLNEKQLEARYEGPDQRIPRQQQWRQLRRERGL
ncbi:MAG: DUF3881 family protein [Acidobacteriota bacterium]|jgi:hypothetical protein